MQFDDFADNYKELLDSNLITSGEGSEYFAEYKARYLCRVLKRDFTGKVLDFGCGVGLLSRFIKRNLPTCELHGFDVSKLSIARVDPRLLLRGRFTSDLIELDYDYAVIVMANVMHHIAPQDRQQLVVELGTRLTSRGRLLIFEHNPVNPFTRRVVDRCPFDKDALLLGPKEMSTYLASAKLRIVRHDYIVFLPRALARLRRLEPLLSWLPLGAQYVMTGEKNG